MVEVWLVCYALEHIELKHSFAGLVGQHSVAFGADCGHNGGFFRLRKPCERGISVRSSCGSRDLLCPVRERRAGGVRWPVGGFRGHLDCDSLWPVEKATSGNRG